jgi:hypothetical protein
MVQALADEMQRAVSSTMSMLLSASEEADPAKLGNLASRLQACVEIDKSWKESHGMVSAITDVSTLEEGTACPLCNCPECCF